MKKVIMLLLVLLPLCACKEQHRAPVFNELDEVLANKKTYDSYFNDRVNVLKAVRDDQKDPEQIYNINIRIAEAYKSHSFDSTIFYLHQNKDIAIAMKDDVKLQQTTILMVESFTMSGYYAEAAQSYALLNPDTIHPSLWTLFVSVSHRFYGEMGTYVTTEETAEQYFRLKDHYRSLMLELLPEGSFDWYYLKREMAEGQGDAQAVLEYAGKMLETASLNSHKYAIAAYFYYRALQEDDPARLEWLARSASADIMCSIKDYTSLNTLARLLFENGDLDRAFVYVADHCMPDAHFFNSRLRQWEISQFFPEIERAYNQRNIEQLKIMRSLMICISCFAVALFFLLIYIFKRQRVLVSIQDKLKESYAEIDNRNRELVKINDKLTSFNAQMQEADKVKQEYIALFLSILSENISKTRQYKNHVLKYIRQGNSKKLVDEIEQLPSVEEDIQEFYQMFDQTFINLYPDFVEKFNELLVEGSAIVPKGDDILTPELRIFALIKLGITDSSKIAALLHYSANTIYNYRAKTKNKARGVRDEFENAVRSIE